MIESWVIDGAGPVRVPLERVGEMLRARAGSGQPETWLTGSAGRSLGFVTNTERAMVMLLETVGDPGGHAVDPGAVGPSRGFVLSNGQHEQYPDEDTVPVADAFRLVEHVVGTGAWPADARWAVDR
ncbi:hypothetical protein ACFV0T_36100 [Streptomyces sp. NPDC059582]|uniref:hypothetical protein n=1 Tax=Streptomyces sp. NPDC059582 TaxID=3346875 RepID=UPI0036C5EF0E